MNWNLYFLKIAYIVSTASKDPSSKIGTVLVKDRKIISTGYNGFPPGISDNHRLNDRVEKNRLIVHAEMNALLNSVILPVGSTLYLWGMAGPPCTNCTKHIITAGITSIVACGKEVDTRWEEDLKKAADLLAEANVSFSLFPTSEFWSHSGEFYQLGYDG